MSTETPGEPPAADDPGPVRPLTDAPSGSAPPAGRVWYASYGSNMDDGRLRYYLAGGRPPGSVRTHPGCRDRSAPERSLPIELPGVLYFATESSAWTGGRGFYDPGAEGRVWARAHLISTQQFSDIAAQEMYRLPGADLDLTTVLAEGREVLGPGRYETLVCPGYLDGLPVLTFTAPWRCADVEGNKPSAAYLRHLAAGLRAAGTWDTAAIARYLAGAPGAAGFWTPDDIRTLLEAA
ncbi:histone deacetylase [Streptomyces sp. NPDC051018]|uniref:histone deacetylase n=1 Tax=Streptomyces sp. NPDC051018 TaxID=3365639 RepID=UPI00378875D4